MDTDYRVVGAVAAGGALGAIARFGVASLLADAGAAGLWSVFVVNVVGALLLGLYAFRRRPVSASLVPTAFVAFGFLGSFTTFSAFSLEVVLLFEDGSWLAGSAYVFLSIGVALVAVTSGRLFAERR